MPWANAADNVWLPLRLRGVSQREAARRIEECLALVGLEDFAKAYPRELSGGMKMRVSIARALSLRPKLLLMDEPFAALDEITRFKLNDDLLRLQRELGCTVVFVTHSVYESVYLSSRIVVMAARPGRVVEEIAVEAPGPRGKDFRTSVRYAQLCAQISRVLLLRSASGGAVVMAPSPLPTRRQSNALLTRWRRRWRPGRASTSTVAICSDRGRRSICRHCRAIRRGVEARWRKRRPSRRRVPVRARDRRGHGKADRACRGAHREERLTAEARARLRIALEHSRRSAR